MWPEFQLMRVELTRIERDQAHRRAEERRLAAALLRERRVERRAERREARASQHTSARRATRTASETRPVHTGRRWWSWSAVTRTRDITIEKA